jgi:hypothetical protein
MTDKVSPQSLGGKARAAKLTGAQKKRIARSGALARWDAGVPQATHEGTFKIGDIEIAAANLPNGVRLLTQGSFLRALGRSRSPKAGTGILSTVDGKPFFLQAEALKPFIGEELMKSTTPIFFLEQSGKRSVGYDAELLPKVAEVYLKLRDQLLAQSRPIPRQYAHIIEACDLIMRGLARVGIAALVDEATGFEADKAKHTLAKILEAFIAKELARWVKTFPDDFYREMFRLRGWTYPPTYKNKPRLVGRLTNDVVYQRLAPGVLEELKRLTPRDEKGRARHRYHQRLSRDIGHPKLLEHLGSVVMAMKLSTGWGDFMVKLNRFHPKVGANLELPLESSQ